MLVATLLVRDEEDIIAANIEHHIKQGVDAFIITDHLSKDKTPDIIEQYPQVKYYIRERDPVYNQWKWVTKMAYLAADMGADWIVHLDADEFWYGFDILKTVPDDISVVYSGDTLIPLDNSGGTCRNFLPFWHQQEMELFDPDNYPYFEFSQNRPMKGTKIVHRPSKNCKIMQGNHDIYDIDGNRGWTTSIRIDHYPVRSFAHFIQKVENGGKAYQKFQTPDHGWYAHKIGSHWKDWYQKKGSLEAEYAKICLSYDSPMAIDAALAAKNIHHKSKQNWRRMSSWMGRFLI